MTYVEFGGSPPISTQEPIVSVRFVAAAIIAGWLILGGWSSARGQVELLPRLETPIDEEDRYGGYRPVSLESEPAPLIVHNEAPLPPMIIAEPTPPWRPCGPQNSFGGNWLFPQTFAGADFRPACARHDACLMFGCTSRKCCDRMFLWELDQACDYSAFPILCRIKAREYYLGVRMFGWMF